MLSMIQTTSHHDSIFAQLLLFPHSFTSFSLFIPIRPLTQPPKMSTPEEWFRKLPPITRTYLVAAVTTTFLVQFKIVSAYLLYLDFNLIFYKFNFWRLITCFLFFGTFSLPFIFTMVMLVQNFRSAETQYFSGSRGMAEFIHLLLFGMIGTYLIHAFWSPLPFPGDVLMFLVMYVWSRKQPMSGTVIYGFMFKAWHVPFLFLAFNYLLGASPYQSIVGILLGHLYHFMTDIVPLRYKRNVLTCPQLLYDIVNKYYDNTNAQPRPAFRSLGQGHRMEG